MKIESSKPPVLSYHEGRGYQLTSVHLSILGRFSLVNYRSHSEGLERKEDGTVVRFPIDEGVESRVSLLFFTRSRLGGRLGVT